MLDSARGQHAVGVDHGVRLGPADALALRGRAVEEIGRAGEGGPRPHADIGVGEAARRAAEGGGHALAFPVGAVDRDRVHRGGDDHPRTQVGHALREGEVRGARVDAAVNMGLRHVDEARGPPAARPWRRGSPWRGAAPRRPRPRGGRGRRGEVETPSPDGGQVAPERAGLHAGAGDPGAVGPGEGGEVLGREPQDRDRPVEEAPGHQRAQGQHILGLAEDEGCGGVAVQVEFEENPASGAGAAARGDGEHRAGEGLSVERVMGVDHAARRRIDAAPKAQAFVAGDHGGPRPCRG
jgi:hypothetical protein